MKRQWLRGGGCNGRRGAAVWDTTCDSSGGACLAFIIHPAKSGANALLTDEPSPFRKRSNVEPGRTLTSRARELSNPNVFAQYISPAHEADLRFSQQSTELKKHAQVATWRIQRPATRLCEGNKRAYLKIWKTLRLVLHFTLINVSYTACGVGLWHRNQRARKTELNSVRVFAGPARIPFLID